MDRLWGMRKRAAITSLALFLSFSPINNIAATAQSVTQMSPEQAVKILQSSKNLDEVVPAIKAAFSTPSTHQSVIAYLDGPSQLQQIEMEFLVRHLPLSVDQVNNPEFLRQYAAEHSVEVNKINNEWGPYVDTSAKELAIYFAQNKDSLPFDDFRHFADSNIMEHFWNSVDISSNFVDALPKDSKLIAPFLDYIDKKIKLASASENWEQVGLGGYWLTIMLRTGSNAAYEEIRKNIISGTYSESIITGFLRDRFTSHRYEPQALSLYEAAFEKFSDDKKGLVLDALFCLPREQPNQSSSRTPPEVNMADPAVYNRLLRILTLANKLNLPASMTENLSQTKTALLDCYAKHGITRPTDAELAAMRMN